MSQIRIKDNSYYSKENFSYISHLTEKIADKTLEQLEKEGIFVFPELIKESDDITKDQMILQSINDVYQSSNVMGFLGLGKEKLIIESRFSDNNKDYLFQYLLEKIFEIPNLVDLETETNNEERIFNLLMFIFPYYLKNAMRKVLYKTYIRNEYNDNNVKGYIDIARHIKQNVPFVGNIAYSQREYSYDNYLMELIRHTIEVIKLKNYGNKVLAKVKEEVANVIESTPNYEVFNRRKIIALNKKKSIRHAYFREYRELQQLCLLILQNQKHQIGVGNNQIYGILFDGAWLWEEYVNSIIKEEFYHPINKANKEAQRLFNSREGLIYPDFISKNAENRIIADAKYKPIDNIGNRDYLQVLAYMFRFDAKVGFYLYPEADNNKEKVMWLNKGSTYERNVERRNDICVIKYGFKIPKLDSNYKKFSEEMKKSEEIFRDRL